MNNEKSRNNDDSQTGSSSRFGTLEVMIKVAHKNSYKNLEKPLKSLLNELESTSRLLRVTEEMKMSPELKKIISENPNIRYLGHKKWEEDRTYNTPFSNLSNETINPFKDEFYRLVTDVVAYLVSKNGADDLKKSVIFDDLMHEASFGKDEAILNAMASGMLDGIAYARKNPDKVSNLHYSQIKLLMQNLILNPNTAQHAKDDLSASWRSA